MKKILLILTISIFSLFTTPSPMYAQQDVSADEVEGNWVQDAEVTFVGKTATRANDFLNWTLQNYDWMCIERNENGTCDNSNNPLRDFWLMVSQVPFALVLLFVLAGAFIMIITRGQNLTLKKFIPRIVFILALMALSFSIVQFLYVIGDIFQEQFLVLDNGQVIQAEDLLYVAFDYPSFTGFRRVGMQYEESAYISLLLVKLTAITYYTMTGILLVRKIILWFFLVLSSVFPLLLFYRPLRNTAKIWVGEFFRWLLYAPLFALFLRGLVEMWREGIPLPFDLSGLQAGDIVYPTAISILLAGPGLTPELNNSVNLRDTFALYVVALIMLWVVIILPFLLLKIFLDYLNTVSIGQNPIVQKLNRRFNIFNPPPGGPSPSPSPEPSQPHSTGKARALPFLHRSTGAAKTLQQNRTESHATREDRTTRRDENIRRTSDIRTTEHVNKTSEVLRNVNINIPKMRDIAKYETQMMQKDTSKSSEVNKYHETLKQIANPSTITNTQDKERIDTVTKTLTQEKEKGNPVAEQVLAAAKAASKEKQAQTTQEETTVPGETPTAQTTAAAGSDGTQAPSLPVVNTTQQVSLEDYEEVRKTWTDNYQNLEPPASIEGGTPSREEWIKKDSQQIDEAIQLLTSPEQNKVDQGMEVVANILPFLLIGGFSKSEVIAYLKAKKEAGKTVLEDMEKKKEEEDTLLDRQTTQKEEEKEMEMKRAIPTEEDASGTTNENTQSNTKDEEKSNQ